MTAQITLNTARALDDWFAQYGCAGCSDIGSEIRVRTLAFKSAVVLDPSTRDRVSLNMSTALAQSGFGPGTDHALTMVLGASRKSFGHCTDDEGNCLNQITPQIPPGIQDLATSIGRQIDAILKTNLESETMISGAVNQIVQLFKQIASAAMGQQSQPQQQPQPQTLPQLPAPAPAPATQVQVQSGDRSSHNILLVSGVALAALAIGAALYGKTKRLSIRENPIHLEKEDIEDIRYKPVSPWRRPTSGYGKMPTDWMINVKGRWLRLYVDLFGHVGVFYVIIGGEEIIVDELDLQILIEEKRKKGERI
jgi:hypothetical protein